MSSLEFTRNQKLALYAIIGVAVIGLSVHHVRNALTGAGTSVTVREPVSGQGTLTVPPDSPSSSSTSANRDVVFQVAGCVKKPGVYTLPHGSRVIDALNAAGGALDGADCDAINLAAKIDDGSRIYVPTVAEARSGAPDQWSTAASSTGRSTTAAQVSSPSSGSSSGSGKLRTPGEGVVHINSASADELQRLPGVGPATAQKILDYRSQIGGFRSPEQLIEVKGIGPKTFEKMKPFVVL